MRVSITSSRLTWGGCVEVGGSSTPAWLPAAGGVSRSCIDAFMKGVYYRGYVKISPCRLLGDSPEVIPCERGKSEVVSCAVRRVWRLWTGGGPVRGAGSGRMQHRERCAVVGRVGRASRTRQEVELFGLFSLLSNRAEFFATFLVALTRAFGASIIASTCIVPVKRTS